MKDNNNFGGEYLKGPKKLCEDCGFDIPIPRKILSLRKLKCPKCGVVYSVMLCNSNYELLKLYKDNKNK